MQSRLAILPTIIFIIFANARVFSCPPESVTKFESKWGGGMGGEALKLESKWLGGMGWGGPGMSGDLSKGFGSSDKNEAPYELHNPNAQERNRLVVEWGKVSMGYDHGSTARDNEYLKKWTDDDSLRPDRQIALRGSLMIESDDCTTRKPINWIQGIRVIVSRVPGKKQDWSRSVQGDDAHWIDAIIWDKNKGEFLVAFPPGEVRRTIGKQSRFQVAVALVEGKGSLVMFGTTAVFLPQSVAMLVFPGQPEISESVQIINGVPSGVHNEFNPAKLVRAVNHLMPLGKEKAIAELRTFLEIARNPECLTMPARRDAAIDSSDRTSVIPIVRLLFESAEPKENLPDIPGPTPNPFIDKKDIKYCLLHPFYLQDDIPFSLAKGGDLEHDPRLPEQLLDWAEKHGKIRDKPLRPIDNPMQAAERLITLLKSKRLFNQEDFGDGDLRDSLYTQAWNIIENVCPQISEKYPLPPVNYFDAGDWPGYDWIERVKAAAKFKIHWCESQNKYIMDVEEKIPRRKGLRNRFR